MADESLESSGPVYVEADEGTPQIEVGRLVRMSTMLRAMLNETREAPLDPDGLDRLVSVYNGALTELEDILPEPLESELDHLVDPLPTREGVSSSAVQLAQAQLLGWLQGLLQGLEASMVVHALISGDVAERLEAAADTSEHKPFDSGDRSAYL